jgi:hypothetical protein
MPSTAREQKEFYKGKIRSLIAIGHGISRLEIYKRLDEEGLHLDRHYVGKLYDDILVERSKRMDRRLLNNALSSFEDTIYRNRPRRVGDRPNALHQSSSPRHGPPRDPRSAQRRV